MEHLLPKWEIDFISVVLPRKFIEQGREMDTRQEIEDSFQVQFDRTGSGRVPGGASGTENLYLDLAIFDGSNGVAIVIETLQKHPVGREGKVYHFDKSRNSGPLQEFQVMT